jgi:hypothetical protein
MLCSFDLNPRSMALFSQLPVQIEHGQAARPRLSTTKSLDGGGWPFCAAPGPATPTGHQRGIEQGTICRL